MAVRVFAIRIGHAARTTSARNERSESLLALQDSNIAEIAASISVEVAFLLALTFLATRQ